MRRIWAVLAASCVPIGGCDGPRFDLNEKVLSSVDLMAAYRTLKLEDVLVHKAGHHSAGYSNDTYEYSEFCMITGSSPLPPDFSEKLAHSMAEQIAKAGGVIKEVKSTLGMPAETSGAQVFFSIAGSKGIVTLRYSNMKTEQTIGYLSCELVEFRR